ncbi:glutamate racemase [Oleiphilus messinensis]|uniref:Glutamate racemase n=1 Tax=Oleiphilus messinensis TaxID=141451 RepID=A0A1Y0IF37_9GAMM|nr:glutamate racemase [Oleiphilus messinensis]ARU58406.1 glutamate racemase [Oleiphilus messinensis]
MSPNHILVFDSGAGGLSICHALYKSGNSFNISYLADDAVFPYGELSEAQVTQRMLQVVLPWTKSLAGTAELLIVACNTASTLILPFLRANLLIPVVGVVPAVKPAAAKTRSGRIGLLATPATVNRAYTEQLITDFAPGMDVVKLGSSALVTLSESYLLTGYFDLPALRKIVSPLCRADQYGVFVDQVILGCTHFPFLLGPLREAFIAEGHPFAQRDDFFLDSGGAVSRRVHSLIEIQSTSLHADSNTIKLHYTDHNRSAGYWCEMAGFALGTSVSVSAFSLFS